MCNCDFCKIISKELDTSLVYETDKNIAFLDYGPINEGHVLICPKMHEDSITKIPNDTLIDMIELIRKLVTAFEKEYGAKGYGIMQNGGENCDYGHFHMHVFPRFEGDGFGWTYSEISHDHSKEVAAKLRKYLE